MVQVMPRHSIFIVNTSIHLWAVLAMGRTWKDREAKEGNDGIVVGKGKDKDINYLPFCSWYILETPDSPRRCLVVGDGATASPEAKSSR